MIIVGELINSSRKGIASAIETRDAEKIQTLARDQAEGGADYIDVNAGTFEDHEGEFLKWLIKQVQEVVDLPCCIDSANPVVIEAALAVHRGPAMINSISLEKGKCEGLLDLIAGTDLRIVALCMSDAGMPRTAEDRVRVADELVNILLKTNLSPDQIFVDPLVQSIATDQTFGMEFLKAVERIMARFEGVHTICGLSNISFGMPLRKNLNRTFMAMAVAKGLDAAILDPTDRPMMAAAMAAETLAGRDRYCMNFINAYREKRLEFV